ncbi:hypothetical protein [Niveispirillum fermenti]|uniref:hypothetical protein n=1 Tax=Niveispirillum fermenti TaxID=1233113 RepID=UPI00404134C1
MASDGCVAPDVSCWPRNTLRIQFAGNTAWADTVGEFPEDAPHDAGLGIVDPAISPDGFAMGVELPDHVIAIAKPAARFTLLDTAAQAAVGLCGKVLEEQGVHRPLQADVHFVDFVVSQRDDLDAEEGELTVKDRDVGLVAGQSVQGLGQHDVDRAGLGVAKQRLNAGPSHHGRTGSRCVLVAAGDFPALPKRPLPTNPDLVLDGGRALLVGRISGVNGGTHAGTPGYEIQPVRSGDVNGGAGDAADSLSREQGIRLDGRVGCKRLEMLARQ